MKLPNVESNVSGSGTTYDITAIWNEQALIDLATDRTYSDTPTITGKNVAQLLQTGPESLTHYKW